jgi:tetratricopeptide (TPR) repeat protein
MRIVLTRLRDDAMTQMSARTSLAFLLLFYAGCATTPPPLTAPVPVSESLIDPRIIDPVEPSRSIQKRFDAAWGAFQSGQLQQADRQFTDLLTRNPDYLPAQLAQAAIAITGKDFDRAGNLIEDVSEKAPGAPIVDIYRGELAAAQGDLATAHTIYKQLIERGNQPQAASDRYQQLRSELFSQLYSQATSEPDIDRSVRLLRESLEVNSNSTAARRLLSRRLVENRQFDEAQRELDTLLVGPESENDEVQQLLAEVDAGQGRFQEAIVRYERLVRRSPNAAYRSRLEQIKKGWREANMPAHQRHAVESFAVTREDLAVLIYWNVPAVRFARNLSEPPIAVDIQDVVGREELIRAMSFRFFTVDPVTRRVEPYRVVSAATVLRILSRLLALRGTPSCAGEALRESNEILRASRVLESCGISVPELTADPDGPVPGRVVERALTQIAARLSTEERQARQ